MIPEKEDASIKWGQVWKDSYHVCGKECGLCLQCFNLKSRLVIKPGSCFGDEGRCCKYYYDIIYLISNGRLENGI